MHLRLRYNTWDHKYPRRGEGGCAFCLCFLFLFFGLFFGFFFFWPTFSGKIYKSKKNKKTKKKNQWVLTKLKSFCIAVIIKMKSWLLRKNICKDMIDKRLIFKIYKKLIKLSIRRKKNLIRKTGGKPEQAFFQRRHIDG